jgi:hypothetical protein
MHIKEKVSGQVRMYFVDFKKCKITDRIAGQHASID